MPRSSDTRKTVGLFTDWLKDPYQNCVAVAVSRACAELDTNLLCVAGGHLDPKGSHWARRNIVYEFAGPQNLDATIVMGANVGTLVGPDSLKKYLDQYPFPNPISVAYRLEGMPSVVIDNTEGMRRAIEHLIDVHHRTKIGFIRGPVENTEAEERFAVYRAVLAERGLAYDPRRVMVGDFLRPSGATAMQAILESRSYPDAIIAANDLMALGALDILKAEGVKVPEDVSVIGFDDVDEASLAIPQLTTVRQPFSILGREAVRMALALARGEQVDPLVTVPTRLVVRRSCGCGANSWDETEQLSTTITATATQTELRSSFVAAFATLSADGVALSEASALELFDIAVAEVEQGNVGQFARQLSDFIRSDSLESLTSYSRLLTILFRTLHAWADNDEAKRLRADELGRQVRSVVGDLAELSQGIERVRQQRLTMSLCDVGRALLAASSIEGIGVALESLLPSLGIRTGYLSLYRDAENPHAAATLIWAKNSRDHGLAKSVGQEFESKNLVPFASIFREQRESLILLPLFFEEQQLGTLTMALGTDQGVVYEAIRDQTSSAVRVVRLLERLGLTRPSAPLSMRFGVEARQSSRPTSNEDGSK